MKLQASAPRLRKSSSGPDSKPAPGWSPFGFSSRFCTRDRSSGFGEFFFFSSILLNMGFLLPRRRASCRMPVRGAGVAILSSLEVKGSAGGRGIAGETAGKGCFGTGELLSMCCDGAGLIYKEEEAVAGTRGWDAAEASPSSFEGVDRNIEVVDVRAVLAEGLVSGAPPTLCSDSSCGVGLPGAGIYRDVVELTGPRCPGTGVMVGVPGAGGEKEGTTVLCPLRLSLGFLGADGLKMTEVVAARWPEEPGVKGRADLLNMLVELAGKESGVIGGGGTKGGLGRPRS